MVYYGGFKILKVIWLELFKRDLISKCSVSNSNSLLATGTDTFLG